MNKLNIKDNEKKIDIESSAALTNFKENDKGLWIVNNIGWNVFTEGNELAAKSLEEGSVDFFNPQVKP